MYMVKLIESHDNSTCTVISPTVEAAVEWAVKDRQAVYPGTNVAVLKSKPLSELEGAITIVHNNFIPF